MSDAPLKYTVEHHGKDLPAIPEAFDASSSISTVEHGKALPKIAANEQYLDVPLQSAFARTSDTFSDHSLYSAEDDNERRTGRLLAVSSGSRLSSLSPAPPTRWKDRATRSWTKNKGLALVCLAQFFGVMMNVTIRVLEMDGSHGPAMHPFQVSKA